jgi:hypothetical protein
MPSCDASKGLELIVNNVVFLWKLTCLSLNDYWNCSMCLTRRPTIRLMLLVHFLTAWKVTRAIIQNRLMIQFNSEGR